MRRTEKKSRERVIKKKQQFNNNKMSTASVFIRMYMYRLVFIGDGPVVVRSGRRGMRHLRLHLVCVWYILTYYAHTHARA